MASLVRLIAFVSYIANDVASSLPAAATYVSARTAAHFLRRTESPMAVPSRICIIHSMIRLHMEKTSLLAGAVLSPCIGSTPY